MIVADKVVTDKVPTKLLQFQKLGCHNVVIRLSQCCNKDCKQGCHNLVFCIGRFASVHILSTCVNLQM